jgi:hypothetical protein
MPLYTDLPETIRDTSDSTALIRKAKIFPIIENNQKVWSIVSGKKRVVWIDGSTKSANLTSPYFNYIDPAFTYNPGGKTPDREKVAKFSSSYRKFLNSINIKQESFIFTS